MDGVFTELLYDKEPVTGRPIKPSDTMYPLLRRVQQGVSFLAKAFGTKVRSQSKGAPTAAISQPMKAALDNPPDPNTGKALSGKAEVKIYAPNVFADICALSNIDPLLFLDEFVTTPYPGLLPSPGKSPTFFLYGQSGLYIIKQLKHAELKLLMRLAVSYRDHLRANANSLLIRLFAVFRIKTDKASVHLTVMPNLFFTQLPIIERFDIKGSYVGRSTKHPERPGAILKDNDLKSYIFLSRKRRRFLVRMLRLDAEWLAQHNLIDYSLLLGISEPLDELLGPRRASGDSPLGQTPFEVLTYDELFSVPDVVHSEAGGIVTLSQDAAGRYAPKYVVYLGIIDFLTEFRIFKALERRLKGLTADKDGVSAVPAGDYKDRFLRFIRIILQTPNDCNDISEWTDYIEEVNVSEDS